MGSIRNGARQAMNLLAKVCKLSKLPGFRGGIASILGAGVASDFFVLWDPLCAFIDVLISADNWYNQIDATSEVADSEDAPGV